MSKHTNHGTQPNKGTIPRPTVRRNEPELLHNRAITTAKTSQYQNRIKIFIVNQRITSTRSKNTFDICVLFDSFHLPLQSKKLSKPG